MSNSSDRKELSLVQCLVVRTIAAAKYTKELDNGVRWEHMHGCGLRPSRFDGIRGQFFPSRVNTFTRSLHSERNSQAYSQGHERDGLFPRMIGR